MIEVFDARGWRKRLRIIQEVEFAFGGGGSMGKVGG